jgi:hypothetical protein
VPQRPRCASIQRKKLLLTSIAEAVYQAEPFRHLNLRFRALPDALVEDAAIEASDLCLILADSVHLQRKGIYVNSNVRTVRSEHEIASARQDFPSRNALLLGYWFSHKDWLVALLIRRVHAVHAGRALACRRALILSLVIRLSRPPLHASTY